MTQAKTDSDSQSNSPARPWKANLRLADLGVMTERELSPLLICAINLAASAGKAGNSRDYATAMNVVLAIAKLEKDLRDGNSDQPLKEAEKAELAKYVAQVRRELLNEPRYLDWLRTSALDADAGPLRSDSEPGRVEARATLAHTRSGDRRLDRTPEREADDRDDAPTARQIGAGE